MIENCVLRGNRAQVTGSAIDLLQGSAARIVNCLLVSNVSNTGFDVIAKANGGTTFTNSAWSPSFWRSRAEFRNCTFTGNRNAVDDMGGISTYTNCIFADDVLAEGLSGTARYELNLYAGAKVSGCLIRGAHRSPPLCIRNRERAGRPAAAVRCELCPGGGTVPASRLSSAGHDPGTKVNSAAAGGPGSVVKREKLPAVVGFPGGKPAAEMFDGQGSVLKAPLRKYGHVEAGNGFDTAPGDFAFERIEFAD